MKRLSELHPEIENKFFETYSIGQSQGNSRIEQTKNIIRYVDKIINASVPQKIAVIGCGPVPVTMKILALLGHEVIGYEPVETYVHNANEFLDGKAKVEVGSCEIVPAVEDTFDIIFCESVLEHVDSPERSLNEFYRILKPGGVVYISTENKLRFSPTGRNSEYRVPFYNWFPDSVKEGYINLHLNHKPYLANYTPIPAVHWYTYSSLCRLGRYAGFAKFYSIVDVLDDSDPRFRKYPGGKLVLKWVRKNPWIRSIMLRQFGGTIFMFKRKSY